MQQRTIFFDWSDTQKLNTVSIHCRNLLQVFPGRHFVLLSKNKLRIWQPKGKVPQRNVFPVKNSNLQYCQASLPSFQSSKVGNLEVLFCHHTWYFWCLLSSLRLAFRFAINQVTPMLSTKVVNVLFVEHSLHCYIWPYTISLLLIKNNKSELILKRGSWCTQCLQMSYWVVQVCV